MNTTEQRRYLISSLVDADRRVKDGEIPPDELEQKQMLRALFNIRMPGDVSDEFLKVQDDYLKQAIARKGITRFSDLEPVRDRIYLWRGDITTLEIDAIVNAANSGMTGCYVPNHNCIDNAIHTYAGVQLRNACAKIIEEQGHEEPVGQAKITPAFNLPSRYVIHTVGPAVSGSVTDHDREMLASCYRSCLRCAEDNGIESIAFCSISTGVFGFPKDQAAAIAIDTVSDYLEHSSGISVVFDVFGKENHELYSRLLK